MLRAAWHHLTSAGPESNFVFRTPCWYLKIEVQRKYSIDTRKKGIPKDPREMADQQLGFDCTDWINCFLSQVKIAVPKPFADELLVLMGQLGWLIIGSFFWLILSLFYILIKRVLSFCAQSNQQITKHSCCVNRIFDISLPTVPSLSKSGHRTKLAKIRSHKIFWVLWSWVRHFGFRKWSIFSNRKGATDACCVPKH